jgi:hypothetical protein
VLLDRQGLTGKSGVSRPAGAAGQMLLDSRELAGRSGAPR